MATTLLTLEELAALEERYSHILEEGVLMERAGFVCANWIDDQLDGPSTIVFLCGPGNNGGDGYIAARDLLKRGHDIWCVAVGKPTTKDAIRARDSFVEKGGRILDDPYEAPKADVVVDAIFGVGLNRPITGEALDAVLWFNERQALHMAIDIPSGLDAQTGNWVGGVRGCVSEMTLNLISAKAGCFMNEGKDASGMVTLSELELSVPLSSLGLIGPEDFSHVTELRKYYSHKGTYGKCLIVGGDEGKVGAAILAGRAALRLGAGLVAVELMTPTPVPYDAECPELMISQKPVDLTTFNTIVIGCGLGFTPKAVERLKAVLETKADVIIDADALTIMAEDPEIQRMVLERKGQTVITPHPGEAARILHTDIGTVNADRILSARELALATGAVSVLKGTGTVVSLRSSRAWINPTGSAALATAGTGDVLAGMLGAFFAQGYDMVSATLAAVWLHGESVRARNTGVLASDVITRAAKALEVMRWGADPAEFTDPYDEGEYELEDEN